MWVISVPKGQPPKSTPERAQLDYLIYLLLALPIALIYVRYLAGY